MKQTRDELTQSRAEQWRWPQNLAHGRLSALQRGQRIGTLSGTGVEVTESCGGRNPRRTFLRRAC